LEATLELPQALSRTNANAVNAPPPITRSTRHSLSAVTADRSQQ
jgi:hypothetical protein